MDLEIRPLTEHEFPAWDAFVDASPGGTLFHTSSWLKAAGREFTIYGCLKNKELFAGLPLAHRTLYGFKRASRPSLTPYSGIIFKRGDGKYVKRISQEKEVLRAFAGMLKKEFHSLSFRFSAGAVDLMPFIWEGYSVTVSYTYVMGLDGGVDDLWKSMEDKRRNDIRKAQRDGIRIERSTDFEQAFNLVEKTYSRQSRRAGFKASARRYHAALKGEGRCMSFIARDGEGDPIAVVFIVWDRKRSYYLLGGYDEAKRHHGASALAMWEAIQFSKKELGLKEFDFEGSMVPPIEQFFRKFGGEQTPLYSVGWDVPFLKIPRALSHLVLNMRRRGKRAALPET